MYRCQNSRRFRPSFALVTCQVGPIQGCTASFFAGHTFEGATLLGFAEMFKPMLGEILSDKASEVSARFTVDAAAVM